MNSNKRSSHTRIRLLAAASLVISLFFLTACTNANEGTTLTEPTSQAEAVHPLFSTPANQGTTEQSANDQNPSVATPAETTPDGIVIDLSAESRPINPALLGTNVPAWLGNQRTTNETFIARTLASGTSMIRIPGGSWSNYYEWLPCELENKCPWEWGVLTPTDFINLINTTGLEAMYTVNMNGTAKEAAALVAFFNGSVDDETEIGVDGLGRDWRTVGDWAKLRSDHGNPDPVGITYWEIGNELYAGKQGMGKECDQSWGWEDVWTCDGREYVHGTADHEGFIAFRDAMRAVDPSIMVGAVGVPESSSWGNWGVEVIAEAGDVMDFYIIHSYGFGSEESNMQTILAEPQAQGSWQTIKADIDNTFDLVANGRSVPIAVTEYNLFAAEHNDVDERMSQAVNGLFIADTIGQMMQHGFDIANQWNIAHGDNTIPSRYGLMRANNGFRSPQYYVFPMWSRFGSEMLPVSSPYASDTTLSVYAGKDENGMVSLLVINKTGDAISSNIHILNTTEPFTSGTVDVIQADSLDSDSVTWNGVNDPADDLSNAPPLLLKTIENPTPFTFAPYSVTLIRFVP
ncbi:MAG: alpha-L-arabinofuranosidase [Anaerolineae bacterium]|nr:alpha-L-arabinofuranosidase [Anaerolineae bacterium]